MSTHKVEVVRVYKEPHPDADNLSIVKVFGFTVVVRSDEWNDGDLGAYIPPDSLIDTSRPIFKFFHRGKQWERVTVKRLRGIYSQGLLVKVPDLIDVGDDLMEFFGIEHYNPSEKWSTTTDATKPPAILTPIYDVESWYRFKDCMTPGEVIVVTEKIHGASCRVVWWDNKLHVGSRTTWKREDPKSVYWASLKPSYEVIEAFCKDNPGLVLYGETYGQVQNLRYGAGKGDTPKVMFAGFDMFDSQTASWITPVRQEGLAFKYNLPWVPYLFFGAYSDGVESLADGKSKIPTADHIREGVVIKPFNTVRFSPSLGRVILKIVSNKYLEKDYYNA
jgi:RNA ligase (TIGR02306 family)